MDTINHSTVVSLKDSIQYAEGAVVSKTLTKNKSGNTTLFAFDKGQGLSEHTAPFDAIAQIVDGTCKITIGGEDFELEEGQMILMPATIPHAVEAIEPFKMMLIMIKDAK
ncbi:cupin domain-containing protein [Ekhidna sp.]|uniref:cupin domain-containing protein n=1 Tax=Ekhidna sp. TaxID=2608089 RepID=UPI003B503C09